MPSAIGMYQRLSCFVLVLWHEGGADRSQEISSPENFLYWYPAGQTTGSWEQITDPPLPYHEHTRLATLADRCCFPRDPMALHFGSLAQMLAVSLTGFHLESVPMICPRLSDSAVSSLSQRLPQSNSYPCPQRSDILPASDGQGAIDRRPSRTGKSPCSRVSRLSSRPRDHRRSAFRRRLRAALKGLFRTGRV